MSRTLDNRSAPDATELTLVTACARGDSEAIAELRTRYFDPLAPALGRMGLGAAQIDDAWQTMCNRLLVPRDGEQPRILRYAGRGELRGLVRVAATRMALNVRQRERLRTGHDEWIDRLPTGHADPELHAIKLQHRSELKQELEAAVGELTARDRMLLRLHFIERIGIDAIAAMCSLHRSTAARSIVRARETLAARVRARLLERWRVARADLAGLKTLVDSQLELSLHRLLAAESHAD